MELSKSFIENFWATFSAIIITIIGGVILEYIKDRKEKNKVFSMIKQDCYINWKNIDNYTITENTNNNSVYYNYKNNHGINFHGNSCYMFPNSTLKFFETEGGNILKHLNKNQSLLFWELYNKLFEIENIRQILLTMNTDNKDYLSFQKLFVIFSKEALNLYIKLDSDLRKINQNPIMSNA